MGNLSIRNYHPNDLGACRALWVELTQRHREIYADPAIGGADPGRCFDEHLAQVGQERIWVAERQGEIIGLVGLILQGKEAEVEPVVVAAQHRNTGVGEALLEHIIAIARDLDVTYLNIRPVGRNVAAIRRFHRSGFRTLGRLELFIDLRPDAATRWQSGPEIFDLPFSY